MQCSLQRATDGCLRQSIEPLVQWHKIEDLISAYEEACPMVHPADVAKRWRDLRDLTGGPLSEVGNRTRTA